MTSNKGLKTSTWGKAFWHTLFCMVAGGYPEKIDTSIPKHKKIQKAFICTFESLKYTLPCGYCRDSFSVFYEALDIKKYYHSREGMMLWLYTLKDMVNTKLGKKTRVSFETVVKRYEKCRSL